MSFITGFFKRYYWKHFRSELQGVACLAECEGKILLIRHRYGRRDVWSVPTGAKGDYEKPKRAAVREIWNLMGVDIRDASEVDTVLTDHDDPNDMMHCFIVHLPNMSMDPDRDLIAEAKWFDLERIPSKLSLVAKILIHKLKYETEYQLRAEDPMNEMYP